MNEKSGRSFGMRIVSYSKCSGSKIAGVVNCEVLDGCIGLLTCEPDALTKYHHRVRFDFTSM